MTTILTQSTLWLGSNCFGKTEKLSTPEIEIVTKDVKVGFGTLKLPVGINALGTSFEFTCLDKTIFNKIANPFNSTNFTIYGSASEFNNETLVKETPVKLICRGSLSKRSTLGELVQQENSAFKVDMNLGAYKLIYGNETWEHFDATNLIWKINGEDVLKNLKKNLAL